MQKRQKWAIVLLSASALIAGGGVVASNMGHKHVAILKKAAAGVSKSGTNPFGLPYMTKPGIDTARDLFTDLLDHDVSVQNIQKLNIASDSNAVYTYGRPDFALVAGEGYLVKVGGTVAEQEYKVVGSHNPGTVIHLKKALSGTSKSGTNRITLPYNAVSGTARELFVEIEGERSGEQVQNIQRYDRATDQWAAYAVGLPDFPLKRGESYQVKIGVNDVDFTPEYY